MPDTTIPASPNAEADEIAVREAEACPECGSTNLSYRNGRCGATWTYYCNKCGDRFDDPVVREGVRDQPPRSGPAYELWKMGQEAAEDRQRAQVNGDV